MTNWSSGIFFRVFQNKRKGNEEGGGKNKGNHTGIRPWQLFLKMNLILSWKSGKEYASLSPLGESVKSKNKIRIKMLLP